MQPLKDAGGRSTANGAGGYGHAQAGDRTAKAPKIYYATRTHSQIAQVPPRQHQINSMLDGPFSCAWISMLQQ